MENDGHFKLHWLIRYPLLIILVVVGNRVSFAIYNFYWDTIYAAWPSSALMEIFQIIIIIILEIIVGVGIGRIAIRQKNIRVQDFFFNNLQPKNFGEWLLTSILILAMSIILTHVILNFAALIGHILIFNLL